MGFFDGPTQVTNSNPWAMASPYLQDIMRQSQQLYGQQAPQYTNPAGNFGYNPTTAAVGNSISGNTPLGSMTNQIQPIATGAIGSSFASPFGTAGGLDATGAIKQQLSGQPDYTAVNGAIGAANTQQWNQFYNNVVPQLNQRASFLGNPSGAIKDLNSAVSNIGQNQSLNAQQAYLGQYNDAQQRQQAAAQLVSQGGLATQQNATSLGGLGANLAANTGAQSLQGASQFGSLAQMPNQNLSDYADIVSNTGGKFGSDTTQNQPGAAGTAANVIGGLTAGAGLANTLFGPSTPATTAIGAATGAPSSGGLVGQIGSLFGSGAPAVGGALGTAALGSGAAATGAVGSTLGSVGATTAGDSAAIAAGNSAWLGAQPAALGGSVGSGGAAGAAGAAGGDAAAGGAAGGAASAGGGSGAAAGSLAGGAVGLGILAAPAIAGMMTQGVQTNAAYAKKLDANLNSSDPNTASAAMYELLAAQNDKDNRVSITPAQQQRIDQLNGGLLKKMYDALPYYQGHQQIQNRPGTQIQ